MKRWAQQAVVVGVGLALAGSADAILINATFIGYTAEQTSCGQAAIDQWQATLMNDDRTLNDVTLVQADLGSPGPLGSATFGAPVGQDHVPWGPNTSITVTLNTQYIDQMQFDHTAPVAGDKFDGLTIFRHELGHAVGVSEWYDAFDAKLTDGPGAGERTYNGDGFTVLFSADETHVADPAYPDDLMVATLGAGVRRDISEIDLDILADAYGYVIPEPATLVLMGLGMLALLGGAFRGARSRIAWRAQPAGT